MKRFTVMILITFGWMGILICQDHYKIDFLTMMDKIPVVKTCEDAYKLVNGEGTSYKEFADLKTRLDSTLTLLGISIHQNMSATQGTSGGNVVDAQALQDKLEKMTDEEKQQWAVQNARNFSPGQVGANKDMNNEVVNDAVAYVKDLQDQTDAVYAKVEEVNAKQEVEKEKLNAKIDWEPNAGGGEITEEIKEKCRRGYEAYKKGMVFLNNEEMNEKSALLMQYRQDLISKYKVAEEKIAATHYADDAQQPSNKLLLLQAHYNIGVKVTTLIGCYKGIFEEYSRNYFNVINREPFKEK